MNLLDLAPKPEESKNSSGFSLLDLSPPKPIFHEESETDRIINLPITEDYDVDLSWIYEENATIECRPLQYTALAAAYTTKGLVANLPVGYGKTLIAYLLCLVLKAKRPLIMMPSNMIEAFTLELEKYKPSFKKPADIKILSYEILSSTKSSNILHEIQPDLIVADEAHCLASKSSSRAIRFRRYMKAHPETYFCAMSATFLKKSILDLAPIMFLALRHLSPLPNDKDHAELWSECVDANGKASQTQWNYFSAFTKAQGINIDNLCGQERKMKAREAVFLRMCKTAGFVTSQLSSSNKQLTIRRRYIDIPSEIEEAISIAESGETPDHEDIIVDDVHKARVLKNLSSGFYYRWAWEKIGGRDEDWLLRRKLWHRDLRKELLNNHDINYDSPFLITNAILKNPQHKLRWSWDQWDQVRHKPVPPTEVVWLNKFLVQDVLDQLNSVPTIVWYSSSAMEEELAKFLPVFGSGTLPPKEPITCAMSIAVHGTGKNLQKWHRNIVVELPGSAVKWEQLLGRTDRPGQTHDVECIVYAHSSYNERILSKVIEEAKFLYSIQKMEQKLLIAKWE